MLTMHSSLHDVLNGLLPLLLSMLCGGVVGMERRLRRKPTGLRTNMLVCLGTTVYMQLGTTLVGGDNADPTRILGQIVVGIGFLGAGSIFTHSGFVVGLTTAATIWMNAAIGAAIGLGYYFYAVVCTLLCMGILYFVPIATPRPRRSSHHGSQDASDDEEAGERE